MILSADQHTRIAAALEKAAVQDKSLSPVQRKEFKRKAHQFRALATMAAKEALRVSGAHAAPEARQ